MDRLTASQHQRHSLLALRHKDGLTIRDLHGILRGIGDALVGICATACRFREFLAWGVSMYYIDSVIMGTIGQDELGMMNAE